MTTIEWTDETWNPVTGCEKISPGCKHCYAKALHDMRHQAFLNGKNMPAQYAAPFESVRLWPERLKIPLRWRAPRLCFVNSMSDLFHEDVPLAFIDDVLEVIHATPHITYQVLTKRAERLERGLYGQEGAYFARTLGGGDYLANLWIGVSVEDKKHLDRLEYLRAIEAAVRMVSFDPLLEDLGKVNLQGIGWAIAGGESGRGAGVRPMHPDWVRSLRDQCLDQGVPFFFKQWGEWAPLEQFRPGDKADKGVLFFPGIDHCFQRAGKKHAGALLDGREWREFPKPYPGHAVVRLQRKKAVAA